MTLSELMQFSRRLECVHELECGCGCCLGAHEPKGECTPRTSSLSPSHLTLNTQQAR